MKNIAQQLRLYAFLSKFAYLKSYKIKILSVAFLGTHVPLLALLLYFLLVNSFSWEMTAWVLGVALVATLIGTGLTIYALHQLLAPIILTYLAQRAYLNHKQLPHLPTHYTDEAGTLMADTVRTIEKLDSAIEHLTYYDPIVNLPNRALFIDRLQQVLVRSQTKEQLLAVMVLKINNLREINNALGSEAGNQFLKAIAHQLTSSLNNLDLLCRISDDEFAIALSNLTTTEEAIAFCQSLLSQLVLPIILNDSPVHPFTSLGIAICPDDGRTVEQLIQNAHTAVDAARRHTPNSYQFYSAQMNAQLQERLTLESHLSRALERNELQLHYQPRIESHSGKIVSVEALLRWNSRELGAISPAKFIPIAEANGLIVPIGEWVLRTACTQHRLWQQAGLPPLRMAVNLSARQLAQPNLVERITSILEETQIQPQDLELEVTESLMMDNVQQSILKLQQFREMGIKLALDDFGTGYSSLNYLRSFPIDTLKIDRSFIRDVVSNAHNAAVTNAIITLAKSLRLNITAEGVETAEQCEYIKAQGCHEIQGYYFSPPLPKEAMTELLAKQTVTSVAKC
ncbi:EAL domain-containing protein [Desertifilum sp. FACHB-1129]|uniref:Diguanylate phosphodiesterase n=1 Tax=Desertifilum tharense IPPAS B-1220 TaxID=1781255 RepID=A0A1E5QI49_9CYAN|nr:MULTISPECIES: GGDEF domain-containing phosphodiesterase [unclassified Desertifilum]MDA0209460.1 EAL domain-containing protein [Cyanobacteria bacterium FC1]OEJ74274.1 diguanylate phosphodiesterase [Desertifilum tharense IPPAS B-1220]MBD2314339.1 EAL domain-containing protein [Desertifilum sp. FACHB-1129]MBD2324616.1 EAL domain-containing protein [Desertifilum sp. FACHB-866]MBD2334707.1 EAL domain-containing protein [Desertifilum sp. FACHB-868]